MKKNIKQQIIAIGGGGFSKIGEYSPSNSLIEEYFLQQTGKTTPSVCFIPTASGEASKYIIDFLEILIVNPLISLYLNCHHQI